MSTRHPVIAVTGSSGAGTTTVTKTFQHIFRREKINAALVEGDAFHRYDRAEMRSRTGWRPGCTPIVSPTRKSHARRTVG